MIDTLLVTCVWSQCPCCIYCKWHALRYVILLLLRALFSLYKCHVKVNRRGDKNKDPSQDQVYLRGFTYMAAHRVIGKLYIKHSTCMSGYFTCPGGFVNTIISHKF